MFVLSSSGLTWREVECYISGHDLRRLEKYSKNIVDRHLVTDIVPAVAMLFAEQKLTDLQLSNLQAVRFPFLSIKARLSKDFIK